MSARCTLTAIVAGAGGVGLSAAWYSQAADAPLDTRRVDTLTSALLPGARVTALVDEWVGARPRTADGLPLIGSTRSRRVHVSGGYGMWGMVLGPIPGRLLARSIATGTPPAVRPSSDALK